MKPNKKTYFAIFLQLVIGGIGGSAVVLAAFFLYLSPNLPSVDAIRDVRLQTPLRIYSADNKLIGEFGEMRRTPVRIEDVPKPFINALLAAEDAEFYSHSGVSLKGLARAVKQLVTTGRKGSGGSTLTMQLTRHIFLALDKKFSRKFNEIILAMKLERELTKDEILELYVNYMYLGNRAYGIQSAANIYYGKELKELSVAQMAMIAVAFQLPSTKNAITNPEWALERRNWILGRMLQLGKLDEETYNKSVTEVDIARYHGNQLEVDAPYIAELAREKTIRSFGLKAYTEGYRVYTTVDSRLQLVAQEAIVDGLLDYDKRHGYRGPELTLDTSELTQTSSDDPEALDYSAWQETLQTLPEYAQIEAAAVIKIEETSVELLRKDGTRVVLDWENGISKARPYINENSTGASPKVASDVFVLGDTVRIRAIAPGQYELVQIPEVQAALVSLNPNNGAIISLVGGFNFYHSHFNRVTQADRQPGSNFKPFIYTSALENGMTAATIINDAPFVMQDELLEGTWRPENDSKKFYGPTRLRKALYLSRNVVSIRVLREIGVGAAIRSLERFGFNPQELPRDLTLALGSNSLKPLELASAWATFANGGHKIEAHLINRVVDTEGEAIYTAMPDTVCKSCDTESEEMLETTQANFFSEEEIAAEEVIDPDFIEDAFALPVDIKIALNILEASDYPKAKRIVDEGVVYIMDSILKDVIRRGTGRRARVLERSDLAGKTGTTNGPNDVWFSGYNADIVTTTWVGFDQQKALGNSEYGGTAALPIWIDFMREALKGTPESSIQQPPSVVTVRINPDTGERASIDDPDAVFEYFRRDHVPDELPADNNSEITKPIEIFSEEIF